MQQNNCTAESPDSEKNQVFLKTKAKIFKDNRRLASLFYSGRLFVAFDTETTGLSPRNDYLIEVGAVKFDCWDQGFQYFSSLIKPPIPISSRITEITGIDDAMLAGEKTTSSVLPEFLKFIGGSQTVLLGHNLPFDFYFVNNELSRLGIAPLNNICIDTLPLSRWAYPAFNKKAEGGYKLQSLAKSFNIEVKAAHRAWDDARVCMEVFKKILNELKNINIKN